MSPMFLDLVGDKFWAQHIRTKPTGGNSLDILTTYMEDTVISWGTGGRSLITFTVAGPVTKEESLNWCHIGGTWTFRR